MTHNLEPEGFMRLPEVLQKIPVSKTRWYDGIKEGRYPKGISLGLRTTAYRVSDIRDLCVLLADGKDWRDRKQS